MKEHRIVIGRIKGSEFYNEDFKPSLEVDVEISLKLEKDPATLSICGNVWNARKSDIINGGQCQDTLRELTEKGVFTKWNVDPAKFKQLLDIWDRWHLNDLNPACEHQRSEHWGKKNLTLGKYDLMPEIRKERHAINNEVEKAIKTTGKVQITPEAQKLLNLPLSITAPVGDNYTETEIIKEFYTLRETETKTSG